MRKNSNGVCIKSFFNFDGQAIKQTRNVISDAWVCAAFVYWEAMQIHATSCIIIMNLIIWCKKVGKVVRKKIMFKLVIEFAALKITRQIWGIWKLRPAYNPKTPNLGQNRWCFVQCDLEIWWMTLENNRASLLCCFKLYATLHSHRWIQTGVTVRKRPIWVKFNDFFLAVWPWNLTYDLEKQ